MEYECGYLKRNSSVPLLSFFLFFLFILFIFVWPQWLFLFNSHLSSLGSFPHFRGNTLYFTRIKEIFHTLQRYSHKEDVTIMMQMYASASVAGYAMILAHHVEMIRARPN